MKKILLSCAMLAMTAWAANAQETAITVTSVTSGDGMPEAYIGTSLDNIIDGNTSTYFHSNGVQVANSYIQLDFSSQQIGSIVVAFMTGDKADKPTASKIQYLADGTTWTDIATVNNSGDSFSCDAHGVTTGSIRLVITADDNTQWLKIAEITVYTYAGVRTETPTISVAGDAVVYAPADEPLVTLSCGTADATIYYTLDGTTPEAGGATTLTYNAPFSLPTAGKNWHDAITIKAKAVSGSNLPSYETMAIYYIHDYCMPIYAGANNGTIGSLVIKETSTSNAELATFADADDVLTGIGGFTDNFFTATAGETLNISLTAKGNDKWGHFSVYADLDGDGVLTAATERILNSGDAIDAENGTTAGKNATADFTIGANVQQGKYLMRVFFWGGRDITGSTDNDPCAGIEGGYYDFAFNVLKATSALSAAQAAAFRAVASETGLRVSGVPAGETISVYTVNSVLVATATAAEGVTELSVPARGVLLVRAGNQVVKVVK